MIQNDRLNITTLRGFNLQLTVNHFSLLVEVPYICLWFNAGDIQLTNYITKGLFDTCFKEWLETDQETVAWYKYHSYGLLWAYHSKNTTQQMRLHFQESSVIQIFDSLPLIYWGPVKMVAICRRHFQMHVRQCMAVDWTNVPFTLVVACWQEGNQNINFTSHEKKNHIVY